MGFFKNFLMRKMIKSQMKGVPETEQERIIGIMEKNPELFQKIAAEVQEKMKQGKDQMAASMEVMQKYQDDLKKLI